ncbi:hypothetical protein BJY04DRAFT_184507 [Aspergillus karnatakaensis]|uniref:uncharacterized protein n=1 Tax=Aspergillus karnatakaensis TaxID=1810916 RepID=UPI003CCD5376
MGFPSEVLPITASHSHERMPQQQADNNDIHIPPPALTTSDHFLCRWRGCNRVLQLRGTYTRHYISQHVSPRSYICRVCSRAYNRRDNLRAHFRTRHPRDLQAEGRLIIVGWNFLTLQYVYSQSTRV